MKKPKSLIQKHQVKNLIPKKKQLDVIFGDTEQQHHSIKSIKVSDLDKYEKAVYGVLRTIANTEGTTDNIAEPLFSVLRATAYTYIDDRTGFEEFEVNEPWVDLYREAINSYLDTFVPELVEVLQEDNELTRERALSITVTETTRLTAITDYAMAMLYNSLIDAIWQ